jgi:GTPase involved in cell partitioning and DNA repair
MESDMYTYREKNFIDRVRLHVFGGKGGAGCVSHLKDHRGLKSKASGGSGGQGGGIYIRADLTERDLSYIKSKVSEWMTPAH